jgi:hypothetical protein
MVYNAMKLFMEINPQLFDDCSNDYNETQASAEARQLSRQHKWDVIAQQAQRRSGSMGAADATRPSRANSKALAATPSIPSVSEEAAAAGVDPMTHEQKRLDALKLQDEVNHNVEKQHSSPGKSRRSTEDHGRNPSSGSGRSMR